MASVSFTPLVLIVCLLGLIDHFHSVRADNPIMCVQCTPADARCESGNMEPQECENSHRYCAHYRVFIGESQGVFRGCSRHWLRGCRRMTIEKQDSMVCYSTCSWDGCNGSSFTSSLLR